MELFQQVFSQKLKYIRKARGFSQKALAEKLGYSEKTISKWECGKSMPTLDVFFEICDVLNIDSRAWHKNSDKMYFLGIDGGGTKTSFVLCNETGETVSCYNLGESNPNDVGIEKTKQVLTEGINKVCDNIPHSSIYLFAGIAGLLSGNKINEVLKFFESFSFANFNCGSDIDNIISSGLDGSDGLSVIMGTGFCVFKVENGIKTQIAGWGYFFDEGGGAFNLGRDALSAVFSDKDGSGEKTYITKLIDPEALNSKLFLSNLYEGGKKEVAKYAPLVFEAYKNGDIVAKRIIERNMAVVAEKIEYAASLLNQDKVKVVIAGGLTKESSLIGLIQSKMKAPQKYTIETLSEPPVNGAVKLAKKLYTKGEKK